MGETSGPFESPSKGNLSFIKADKPKDIGLNTDLTALLYPYTLHCFASAGQPPLMTQPWAPLGGFITHLKQLGKISLQCQVAAKARSGNTSRHLICSQAWLIVLYLGDSLKMNDLFGCPLLSLCLLETPRTFSEMPGGKLKVLLIYVCRPPALKQHQHGPLDTAQISYF